MKQNITLNGQGNVPSGEYDAITISGYGSIDDGTTANSITLNAFGKVGDVVSSTIKATGSFKFLGTIEAKDISLSGKALLMKEVKADSIKCYGLLNVEDDAFVTDFLVKGCIKATKSIFCESFMLESNDSNIASLRAKSVIIRPAKVSIFRHRNKCNFIVASAVDISNVDVITIHGDNVIIGPYCTIDEVFYQSSLIIDPSSVVKNKVHDVFTCNDKNVE